MRQAGTRRHVAQAHRPALVLLVLSVRQGADMRPSWTNNRADQSLPIGVPAAIRMAAQAIKLDANYARRTNNGLSARALEHAARCLERVANGQTWAQAFGWDDDKKDM